MADSLIANANGRYYRNLSLLTGNGDKFVKVIVEDELDVPFWKDVLSYTDKNHIFNVFPYSYNTNGVMSLTKGKHHILQMAQANQLGSNYIGCVDSDYDYLLSAYKAEGQLINACPYLLQTYTYSIENLLCYASTLEEVCTKACLDNPTFDIIGYMDEVSRIIYPLLIWALFLEANGYTGFTATQWDNIFPCDKNIYAEDHADANILSGISTNVQTAIAQIEALHSDKTTSKEQFEEQITQQFNLTAENCYLYVRGHDIYKFILKVILEGIQKETKRKHINEIRNSAANGDDIQNRINQYNKNIVDPNNILSRNYEYKHHCQSIFNRIKIDIENSIK